MLTAAVPEPSTYVLLLGGLVAIGLRRSIVGTWMRRRDCSS
ncbi:MAG TPA: PEP-CTERM sorting domain-containing protein [Burkholderiaceae bacterium]|nr:PEP-CTERM sorting domain-containing protein [Burkholderiaceae bacterium]